MSVKLFKYILVVTNLILIVLPIIGIVLSYFFLVPRILTDFENEDKVLTLAFSFWGLVLILTSFCFLGVAFTRNIFLHLISALLLCIPLALGVWLVVEQFLFRPQPNWLVVTISFSVSLIWSIQIFTKLILACLYCCLPKDTVSDVDPEKAEEPQEVQSEDIKKPSTEDGTAEEKEKLVICAQETQAFVPSPQGPPIEEVDEEPEEEEEEDDDDEEEEDEPNTEREQFQLQKQIDEGLEGQEAAIVHPQELPLQTIPEEKQQLLPKVVTTSSGGGGSSVQCPLATPEDTGV